MKYAVTIEARVKKTLEVDAKTADEAAEAAHEQFSVLTDAHPEQYEQDTVSVEKISL